MDFFGAQDQARKRSRRLVIAFAGCVTAVVIAIYLVLAAIFVAPDYGTLWDPVLLVGVAVVVGGVILIATATKLAQWRSGGGAVARSLGGREVPADPTDPLEKRLRNIVEEMALAAGLPVPEVYVLDREDGINAFAAGHHPGDAAVAVTRGALRQLSRDEMQGVIAHEFSHIRHADMALNLRLAGFAFGLAALALVGYLLFRSAALVGRGGRSRESGAIVIGLFAAGALVWLFGSLGELAARILQSAVSRQREFLADAAAVQFTRNPGGLVGALRRIAAGSAGSRIEEPHARETAHLFFAPALSGGLSGLLATHPPIGARLKALDPSGVHTAAAAAAAVAERPAAPAPPPPPTRRPAAAGLHSALRGLAAGAMAAAEADPGAEQLARAAGDLDALPDPLRTAADVPAAAAAIALLLATADHSGPPPLPPTPDALSGPDLDGQLVALRPHISGLDRHLRLVALEHVAPAFRRLGPAECVALRRRLERLVQADDQVTAYEFALLLLTRSRLARPPMVLRGGFRPFAADALGLLATLARAGGTPKPEAVAVAAAALRAAGLEAGAFSINLDDAPAILDCAERLRALPWSVRPAFLQAAAKVVEADGQITADEHDLLRALAHALDCPMPALAVA
jgi:Zn-dependent protease with chaperone function